jgi:hypothetical protein
LGISNDAFGFIEAIKVTEIKIVIILLLGRAAIFVGLIAPFRLLLGKVLTLVLFVSSNDSGRCSALDLVKAGDRGGRSAQRVLLMSNHRSCDM